MSETNEMEMVQVTAEVKGWDGAWHVVSTERAAAKAASYTLGGRRHAIESAGAILVEFTPAEVEQLTEDGKYQVTSSTGRFRITAEKP